MELAPARPQLFQGVHVKPSIRPESFVLTDEFAQHSEHPVAFILPTTQSVRDAISSCANLTDINVIGNPEIGACQAIAEALNLLRDSNVRPLMVVFEDQIVDAANASVLVKSERGKHYISPIALILNLVYGYTLVFWTPFQFTNIAPGNGSIEIVARNIVELLNGASLLDTEWEVRDLQGFRSIISRKYNAFRKLRIFKASVFNTYKENPKSDHAKEIMQQLDAIEKSILKWSKMA